MRLRKFTAAIAALALVLAACGDDDDTVTSEPESTVEGGDAGEASGGDADLQDYSDALATSFREDPENAELGLSDDEIQCFTDDAVEVIGLERMQSRGTPEELVESTQTDLTALELDETERQEIAASLFQCTDGLVERLQEQLVAETGLQGEQADCVAGLFTEELLIDVFAASLSGDTGDEVFSDLESEFQACTA